MCLSVRDFVSQTRQTLKKIQFLVQTKPFSRRWLKHAPLSYKMKHPIVVPNIHPVVSLIIRDIYCRLGHAGWQHVLLELQNKYRSTITNPATLGLREGRIIHFSRLVID